MYIVSVEKPGTSYGEVTSLDDKDREGERCEDPSPSDRSTPFSEFFGGGDSNFSPRGSCNDSATAVWDYLSLCLLMNSFSFDSGIVGLLKKPT